MTGHIKVTLTGFRATVRNGTRVVSSQAFHREPGWQDVSRKISEAYDMAKAWLNLWGLE